MIKEPAFSDVEVTPSRTLSMRNASNSARPLSGSHSKMVGPLIEEPAIETESRNLD